MKFFKKINDYRKKKQLETIYKVLDKFAPNLLETETLKIAQQNLNMQVDTRIIDDYKRVFVWEPYKGVFPKKTPRIIVDLETDTGMSALYFNMKYPEASIYCYDFMGDHYSLLLKNTKEIDNITVNEFDIEELETGFAVIDILKVENDLLFNELLPKGVDLTNVNTLVIDNPVKDQINFYYAKSVWDIEFFDKIAVLTRRKWVD